jgi:4-hydroxy-3-methylbut-2-en-1-yl diphosphate synthase IspG/GcpE
MRNVKTEYVSCPSCGRTLFDLQEVTEQIRTKTGHLPGALIFDVSHQCVFFVVDFVWLGLRTQWHCGARRR